MIQKAIIVDIDGTIAKKHPDRDIYDLSKVKYDLVIEPVRDIIRSYLLGEKGICHPIFVSGRSDICEFDTRFWLAYSADLYIDITAYTLFMRKDKDYRDDTIIKREIYEGYIKGKYDVIAVFDDRPKVVRMWRELGLFVFNCAQHDEEF